MDKDALNIILTITLGIITSLISSVIFWIVSFKKKRTNIIFSPIIEKSDIYDKTGKRFRIRLINTGAYDLFEVNLRAVIYIKTKEGHNYTYFDLGNLSYIPILYGTRSQKKMLDMNPYHTLTFYPNDGFFSEFSKKIYNFKEYPYFNKKALDKTLTFEEIFMIFKESLEIVIHVFGNEDVTGARRHFISKTYRYDDIVEGKFIRPKRTRKMKYKEFKSELFKLDKINVGCKMESQKFESKEKIVSLKGENGS